MVDFTFDCFELLLERNIRKYNFVIIERYFHSQQKI